MITSEMLEAKLWKGADELRGSMDASRYKDYMLGLMFYKFLSEKILLAYRDEIDQLPYSGDALLDAYAEAYAEDGDEFAIELMKSPGFFIKPQYLFQQWVKEINAGTFELDHVIKGLEEFERRQQWTKRVNAGTFDSNGHDNFERMIAGAQDAADFTGLFSTMDLNDSALGSNLKIRSDNIKALIMLFADIHIVELQENDVIGDAYEYLIGEFAMESGKKAGEFYTPHQVSDVIARIVAHSVKNLTAIYDPCVGSGSLLLTVKYYLDDEAKRRLHYYGQEKNTATYNLTRMNLLLHGVKANMMDIRNGDTLADDWPEDPDYPNDGRLFDAVVMNPPYSLKRWNRAELTVSDPRFSMAGVLPPDDKGDYAFLLHGLYHLGEDGTMGIVLPHGVLFRGAAEGIIRTKLLKKNFIDTVIGLPANLFTNTGIPVIVMVLKKNRPLGAPVLLIDASRGFEKIGKNNHLRERDIAKIVDTYLTRSEIAGYSHLATQKEIEENGYNLNIPRYVERIDDDIPHDVDAHLLGGIPKKNIKSLTVLETVMPDVISSSFTAVREGYVTLSTDMASLRERALNDERVMSEADAVRHEVDDYIGRYWEIFKKLSKEVHRNLVELHSTMLADIKEILSNHRFMDVYSGYQIIADLWSSSLTHDLKFISEYGLYDASRQTVPNMVTKGSGDKKHEEQDGWRGNIIPNELISKILYGEDERRIAEKEEDVQENVQKMNEWVEKAATEDTDEAENLGDCLNDAKTSFDDKSLKAALKEATRGTDEYEMIKAVQDIKAAIKSGNKELKSMRAELKERVENRYAILKNDEIEKLVMMKWFDNITDRIVALVREPIERELDAIDMLHERYAMTLDEIDEEISKEAQSFAAMQSELVVTE